MTIFMVTLIVWVVGLWLMAALAMAAIAAVIGTTGMVLDAVSPTPVTTYRDRTNDPDIEQDDTAAWTWITGQRRY
jgi:hypothetical protein